MNLKELISKLEDLQSNFEGFDEADSSGDAEEILIQILSEDVSPQELISAAIVELRKIQLTVG